MFRRRALRRRLASAGAPPLPDDQLRRLVRAIDAGAGGGSGSGGDGGGDCAPVAGGPGPAQRQLLACAARAFRFPELRDAAELRRLPHCTDQRCCNPYHWSRLSEPETPPPPYSRIAMENLNCKEYGESKEDARRTDHERLATGSLATDGEEKPSWETEWCRLAYWEMAQRVGRQFAVRVRAVDVFGGGGGGGGAVGGGGPRTGLCLDALPQQGPHCPTSDVASHQEQVRKTRAKIGLGVTLSLEADGVWLYNRSEAPVFASSPALDAAAAKALLVWRVAPGHCLRVFDPRRGWGAGGGGGGGGTLRHPHLGPLDTRSVRISFAKGWGPKYSRRDVTACPCWLEVLLAPPPPPSPPPPTGDHS